MEALSINLQWASAMRHCAQYAKQGIIAELGCDVAVYWTQCTLTFMNGIFLSTDVANELDLHQRWGKIQAYVRKVQPTFPWALYIEPERLPSGMRQRSQELCLAAGFTHVFDVKCMQTTSLLPPVRPLPTVEIKFTASQQDAYDAALLNAEAYNLNASVAESMVEQRVLVADFDKQPCCTVLVNGKPVATATTLVLDECLYVAFVATSAPHRKVCIIL
ncbi:unnamed protein product, partial [Adineta steineri]